MNRDEPCEGEIQNGIMLSQTPTQLCLNKDKRLMAQKYLGQE
jgi:hypothetical protein